MMPFSHPQKRIRCLVEHRGGTLEITPTGTVKLNIRHRIEFRGALAGEGEIERLGIRNKRGSAPLQGDDAKPTKPTTKASTAAHIRAYGLTLQSDVLRAAVQSEDVALLIKALGTFGGGEDVPLHASCIPSRNASAKDIDGDTKSVPENKSIGNGFWKAETFCFWSLETVPETKGFWNGFGEVDTVPKTEGFGWSETVPETFRFGNSFCAAETFCFGNGFGSTYSVPDTLGFGNVIRAPKVRIFRNISISFSRSHPYLIVANNTIFLLRDTWLIRDVDPAYNAALLKEIVIPLR
ncbi:hypothetical protein B0H10DRAFT_2192563 [Mycena sp. CBHHK59/15]|nr:hypothetical protein B0H10DRAFT_2192563 [Mycena sp. CBHHK59/15]